MENRWNDAVADEYRGADLDMRVYSSRLLGAEPDLVLHGGGNTSVKVTEATLFGEEEILQVKGSGWNLATIERAGFAPVRLAQLLKLAELEELSDPDMMKALRAALVDPEAPGPSVEAILHALIPLKFVDHTHADAIVAISNTGSGEERLKRLYGRDVLVLPYTMPGFVLARQVYLATRDADWNRMAGIVLLHHGVITFGQDARTSYERMIEMVTRAEEFLRTSGALRSTVTRVYQAQEGDLVQIASARRAVSRLADRPMLMTWERNELAVGYSALPEIEEIACRGPLTPDHVLHTKPFPAVIEEDVEGDIERFALDYRRYFRAHSTRETISLDPAPRYAIWRGKGIVCFAPTAARLDVVRDIVSHTARAVQWGQALGGWQPLAREQLFEVEYWDLEQAKLRRRGGQPAFEGKVALVTGGASGIGRACVDLLVAEGAAVVALDIDASVTDRTDALGILCDITDSDGIATALGMGIEAYGGLDLLVSNAGSFPPTARIEALSDEALAESVELNFTGHLRVLRAAIPFLRLGCDPSVVLVGSKNVPAPGPGAAAYSAAKAALTQLGRVAALELGGDGIRVNIVHPNAVFDTGIWTDEVLAARAAQYGMSVEEYKRNNLLHTEVRARDVAGIVAALAGPAFAKTTGAQIPVDGGNDRVV